MRPALGPFPAFENWSFLRNPAARTDRYDRLKFITLNTSGSAYLTLGAENRSEYQYLNSSIWGSGPQDTHGYLVERFMPDADIHLGAHVRVFLGLKFGDVGGKAGGPRPGIDKDIADVHEGFLEAGGSLLAKHSGPKLRIGRQELVFGTGRLVDDNEGVNVRKAFDGVRASYDSQRWRVDLFAVKPVLNNFGAWDDVPNHAVSFWGAYSAGAKVWPGVLIDLYYLGLATKRAVYGPDQAREIRHTGGTRWSNRTATAPPKAGFDYNAEGVVQWGAFGDRSIHAWGIGSETGWTHGKDDWRYRLAIRADAISGDAGHPHSLGTFNALFPRGAFFGPKFALIGPANLLDVQPFVQFHPFRNVTGTAEWVWLWRESTRDAVYGFQNVQLRPGDLSRARYVGSQPNLEIRWAIDEHFIAVFNQAAFFTGTFLHQTPPSRNITFTNIGLTYRF